MLQIFKTQVTGRLQAINERQAEAIEDGARLLAQAAFTGGNIYIGGFGEMEVMTIEAFRGGDQWNIPFHVLPPIDQIQTVTPQDRVILASRFSHDEEACTAARALTAQAIPFLSLTTVREESDELAALAEVAIDLKVKTGLIPQDDGSRIGYPASLVALYSFFLLSLDVN